MGQQLMPIATALMISGGLALIVLGWRSRRSHGWSPVWGGATAVAWATFLLMPETSTLWRYIVGAASVAFLLALFASSKGEAFRALIPHLISGAVVIGGIASLELLAPSPQIEKVLVTAVALGALAFAAAMLVTISKVLKMRQRFN